MLSLGDSDINMMFVRNTIMRASKVGHKIMHACPKVECAKTSESAV